MKTLNNFKIGKRLTFVFTLIVLLSIVNLVYNLIGLSKLNSSLDAMNISQESISYLLNGDRDAYQSSIAISQFLNKEPRDEESINGFIDDITTNREQIKERYDKFAANFNIKGNKEFEAIDSTFWSHYNELIEISDRIIVLMKNKKYDQASSLYFTDYQEHFKPMRESINNFTDIHQKDSEESYSANLAVASNIRLNSIIIFAFIVIIFVVSGIVLIRGISRPLNNAVANYGKNFWRRFNPKNSKLLEPTETSTVLRSILTMSEKISEIVSSIKTSAENFFDSSKQISASSQQIASGANEQASSSEENFLFDRRNGCQH